MSGVDGDLTGLLAAWADAATELDRRANKRIGAAADPRFSWWSVLQPSSTRPPIDRMGINGSPGDLCATG
jgi:hypothetical protein